MFYATVNKECENNNSVEAPKRNYDIRDSMIDNDDLTRSQIKKIHERKRKSTVDVRNK